MLPFQRTLSLVWRPLTCPSSFVLVFVFLWFLIEMNKVLTGLPSGFRSSKKTRYHLTPIRDPFSWIMTMNSTGRVRLLLGTKEIGTSSLLWVKCSTKCISDSIVYTLTTTVPDFAQLVECLVNKEEILQFPNIPYGNRRNTSWPHPSQ